MLLCQISAESDHRCLSYGPSNFIKEKGHFWSFFGGVIRGSFMWWSFIWGSFFGGHRVIFWVIFEKLFIPKIAKINHFFRLT